MKGFQKLTLAAAIAAAPFAQAEMMSIDDAMLGEMTGQAGITIDVDLQMSIDAIKYVDSDGNSQITSAATGQYDAAGVLKNAHPNAVHARARPEFPQVPRPSRGRYQRCVNRFPGLWSRSPRR